jgi:hypothetical protein
MTMNYKELTSGELLAERSHMEQLGFAGETFILDIDEELAARRAAAAAAAPGPKQKEVLVRNSKKGIYNFQAFNTREVERIKVGHWIVVDAYMKGHAFTRLMEQVETISETKCFYIINGKRMKRFTHRIVLN